MKILLLVPFIHDENNEKNLRSTIPMDIDIRGLTKGSPADSRYDETLNLVELIDTIVAAEKEGYDAVVVACQGDPGVREARELVRIPVVAVTESSLHLCATIGHKTCIIAPSPYIARRTRENAFFYGFADSTVVRMLNVTAREGIDAYADWQATGEYGPLINAFIQECIDAIEVDHAEVIMTGCGAVMWMSEIAKTELDKRGYQVPFVNPTLAAVEMAKALVNLGVVNYNYPGPNTKTAPGCLC